jgi:hypothetical protein
MIIIGAMLINNLFLTQRLNQYSPTSKISKQNETEATGLNTNRAYSLYKS